MRVVVDSQERAAYIGSADDGDRRVVDGDDVVVGGAKQVREVGIDDAAVTGDGDAMAVFSSMILSRAATMRALNASGSSTCGHALCLRVRLTWR